MLNVKGPLDPRYFKPFLCTLRSGLNINKDLESGKGGFAGIVSPVVYDLLVVC